MGDRVSRHYAFPPFHFDLNRRWLMRDGERVALSRLPSRLLLRLMENAGRIVTYEDIVDVLWNRRVDETTLEDKRNVHQHISAIRGALGGPLESSRFIVSEAGVGYWFREDALTGMPEAFPAPVSLAAAPSPARDGLREERQREIARLLNEAFTIAIRKGAATPQVGEMLTRARLLCHYEEDLAQLCSAVRGLAAHCLMRGELAKGQQCAEELFSIAERTHDAPLRMAATALQGLAWLYSGRFAQIHEILQQNLILYPTDSGHPSNAPFAESNVIALACLTHACHALGFHEKARIYAEEMRVLAWRLTHPYTMALMHAYRGAFYQILGEPALVLLEAQAIAALHETMRLEYWQAGGLVLHGWALAMQGDMDSGIQRLEQGIVHWRAEGALLVLPRWRALLAEAYGKAGRPRDGLRQIEEALALSAQTQDRHYEAEMHRLKGILLLQRAEVGDTEEAEACFLQALRVARGQRAKAFELRAAVSLGRLRQAQGRHREARRLLAELYGGFLEGFDTPDLQEAKALLVETSQEALAVLGDEELVLYMLSLDGDFQPKDIANALGSASGLVAAALADIRKKINSYF
jgi:predicted ATPase/DNA-binding winged helix-turn-helix (wHTH) protein